jgi:hypothetical protein
VGVGRLICRSVDLIGLTGNLSAFNKLKS